MITNTRASNTGTGTSSTGSVRSRSNFRYGSGSRPFIGYKNVYGYGPSQYEYFIYPDDNWDTKKWGPKPFLGTVMANEPFFAVREAYSKELVPINFTFGLIALKQKLNEEQSISFRFTKENQHLYYKRETK